MDLLFDDILTFGHEVRIDRSLFRSLVGERMFIWFLLLKVMGRYKLSGLIIRWGHQVAHEERVV